LREADGSFSVHPAVRDHFYRLATASNPEAWHEVVSQHLVSLVRQPGKRPPADKPTLDLVEETIYHTLQAGRTQEALWLYNDVLGGLRHLAWKLGEMARGLRILRGFNPCPDRWALGWFLRALGEFEEAYAHNDLPYFRADIRLLQGRLPQVATEGDPTRTAIAAFLMGKTKALPPQPVSCPVPRDQLLLYLGRHAQIRQSDLFERFYHDIGWEGDRARCQLIMAEVAGRQGDDKLCQRHLAAASSWILHSGSMEHLCLMHLVRARWEQRLPSKLDAAQGAIQEGLHIARQCGLVLYLVELLCAAAENCLRRADYVTAELRAREALVYSSVPECQFAWGQAEAGHLLGRALQAQQRYLEARAILEETYTLRQAIGHPQADVTQQALDQLPRGTA
jgi:hypothetical protein